MAGSCTPLRPQRRYRIRSYRSSPGWYVIARPAVVAALSSRGLEASARDGVERDSREQDDAGRDQLRRSAVADQVDAVRDHRDDQCAQDGTPHITPAAEEARATDHRGGDRVEQKRPSARLEVHR